MKKLLLLLTLLTLTINNTIHSSAPAKKPIPRAPMPPAKKPQEHKKDVALINKLIAEWENKAQDPKKHGDRLVAIEHELYQLGYDVPQLFAYYRIKLLIAAEDAEQDIKEGKYPDFLIATMKGLAQEDKSLQGDVDYYIKDLKAKAEKAGVQPRARGPRERKHRAAQQAGTPQEQKATKAELAIREKFAEELNNLRSFIDEADIDFDEDTLAPVNATIAELAKINPAQADIMDALVNQLLTLQKTFRLRLKQKRWQAAQQILDDAQNIKTKQGRIFKDIPEAQVSLHEAEQELNDAKQEEEYSKELETYSKYVDDNTISQQQYDDLVNMAWIATDAKIERLKKLIQENQDMKRNLRAAGIEDALLDGLAKQGVLKNVYDYYQYDLMQNPPSSAAKFTEALLDYIEDLPAYQKRAAQQQQQATTTTTTTAAVAQQQQQQAPQEQKADEEERQVELATLLSEWDAAINTSAIPNYQDLLRIRTRIKELDPKTEANMRNPSIDLIRLNILAQQGVRAYQADQQNELDKIIHQLEAFAKEVPDLAEQALESVSELSIVKLNPREHKHRAARQRK